MNVYWLEQVQSNVPDDDRWLSADEILHLNAFRFQKRRADWRLGRWTAKQAVARYLALPSCAQLLATLEVRPLPSGAPQAFVANQPAHLTISLSHRAGTALCFVAPLDAKLGCDLELIEPHSESFLADYFTPEERGLVAQTPSSERIRTVSLLWSAKESALKALQEGLRADTRTAFVCPRIERVRPAQWSKLEVRYSQDGVFAGWWRYSGDLVRTVVADPSPNLPIALPSSALIFESTPQSGSTSVAHGEDHKPPTMSAGPSP